MLSRLAAVVVAAVAVAAPSGCVGAGVNIVTLRPAGMLDPRGADNLVLVDGEGRRSAKEDVADVFRDEARGGFFHVDDRGDDGIKLVMAGREATVEGSSKAPKKDELFVRIDVLQWEAAPIGIKRQNAEGKEIEVPGFQGRAGLQISIANASGEILMREREYTGLHEVEVEPNQPVLQDPIIAEAAREAVAVFLADITPQRASDYVHYDNGDPGQKALLERTKTEPLRATEKELRRYLKKNESNAIAIYNLAVVLDAQGKFEQAIASYDKALAIVTRDGWVQARGNAVARQANFERVYGKKEKKQKKAEETTTAAAPSPTAPPAP